MASDGCEMAFLPWICFAILNTYNLWPIFPKPARLICSLSFFMSKNMFMNR